MGFIPRIASLAVALGLAVVLAGPAASNAGDTVRARILFDLGDGTYVWSEVSVHAPSADNATWDAVRAAAEAHGLPIESTWFDGFGVGILDIGDRDPPAGFVGLYAWNGTARSWGLTPVGISALVLEDGDAIALSGAAFGGVDYELRFPVPSPERPYPSLSFRSDAANRGASASDAPDTGRLLWDADLGVVEIGSTPAVAYGRAFVSTMEGLVALDADAGGVLWRNPRARGFASPAVFNGTVIASSSDGRVYQLDAMTGAERWNTTLLETTGFSGITSSPKVAFDHVYVGTFNESGGPGAVAALWVRNGTVAWRVETSSVHFSSPALADGILYVGLIGWYNTTTGITFDPPYGLLALDARDGSRVWTFDAPGPVAASPALAGPLVLVSSKDGNVYGIDRETGEERWRAAIGAGISSPAVLGDVAVVGGGVFGDARGQVAALAVDTGAVRWTTEVNGPVQASVALADGKVYASTNTALGTIYALNASTGAILWSRTPSPSQFILGSPVVADGTLFAPSDNGHLYAFRDAPGPAPSSVLDGPALAAVGIVAVAAAAAVAVALRARRVRRGP